MASQNFKFEVTRVRLATGAPQDPLCTEDINKQMKHMTESKQGYIRGIHLNISEDLNTITFPGYGISLDRR